MGAKNRVLGNGIEVGWMLLLCGVWSSRFICDTSHVTISEKGGLSVWHSPAF